MARRAAACGACSRCSATRARIASPMPSLAQRARATCTTPSSKAASIAIPPTREPSRAPVWPAAILQDLPDPRDQPLQGRAVEAVGATEAVHHPGLDVALPGMADVLGARVLAPHRTVLVPPLGGPQVHAHACSVSAM